MYERSTDSTEPQYDLVLSYVYQSNSEKEMDPVNVAILSGDAREIVEKMRAFKPINVQFIWFYSYSGVCMYQGVCNLLTVSCQSSNLTLIFKSPHHIDTTIQVDISCDDNSVLSFYKNSD